MADTSFVGESAPLLADIRSRLSGQEEVQKRAMRRGAAAAAVVVLHVLFLFLLITSEWVPITTARLRQQAPLLWVLLPHPAKTPKVVPLNPKKQIPTGTISAITIPHFPRPEEENNAIDLGLALGRSLACGANSFEYLTNQQRAACRRQPWHFVYDRYGNIVLDVSERPPQEERPRNSDIQAHERNTAPSCPRNVDPNAPCLSAIIPGGQP